MDESAPSPFSSPAEPPPSNPPGPSVSAPAVTNDLPQTTPPLEYEETPVIQPIETSDKRPSFAEASAGRQEASGPRQRRSGSFMKAIGIIALVAILFIGGTWLSGFVRQLIPSGAPASPAVTPLPEQTTPAPELSADPFAAWTSYQVTSGVTRLPFPGLTFKLPADVLPPICDSSGCISQGTFFTREEPD